MAREDFEDAIDAVEGPGGSLEISLEMDDDIDDDEPSGRSERRKQRGNKHREAREEAVRLREENARIQQEMQRLRDEFQHFRGQAEQFAAEIDGEEPVSELDRLSAQEKQLQKEWNALASSGKPVDADIQNAFLKRHQDIRDARQRAIVADEIRRNQPKQQPQMDPQSMAVRVIAEAEYSDVVSDQRALAWADAYHRQQVAKGRKADVALARDAFEAARAEFKTGGRSSGGRPPTDNERARYSGVGAGAGGGGGESPKSFTMTKEFRMMADAMFPPGEYPKLTDQQRYQKWAREVYMKK